VARARRLFIPKCEKSSPRTDKPGRRIARSAIEETAVAKVSIKRAYEAPAAGDGRRVLVDRLWPRGVGKAEAKLDDWLKDVAPSSDLRRWFGHDPERWPEFRRRYRAELQANPAAEALRRLAAKGRLTLIYGARDTEHNDAVVLAEWLADRD
jgi:uncharacterized protein YeaO (DUF488 family)